MQESHIQYKLTPKSGTHQLLNQLHDEEVQYVLELKIVELIIKNKFIEYAILSENEIEYIFGEFSLIIGFHESFINELSKEIQDKKFCEFPRSLCNFIEFLQNYNQYIKRSSNIFEALENLPQNHSKKLTEIEKEFNLQLQIQDYFKLPLTRALSYKQLLTSYLDLLSTKEKPICEQYTKKYDSIVTAFKKCVPSYSVPYLFSEKFIYERFKQELMSEPFKIQKKFEVGRLSHETCLAYIVTQNITENIKKLFVMFVEKGNSPEQEVGARIDYVQYGENSFIVDRPSGFFYQNRLLMIGINKSVCLFFKSASSKEVFVSLIEITRTISRFPDNDIQWMPYQAQTYTFFIIFTIVGKITHSYNLKSFYCIKVQLCAFFDFSEIVYLTQEELETLEIYFKKVHSLKFSQHGLSKKNQELEEVKCIRLQEILNSLVRMEQVRRRPEFLFTSLGVTENVWILAQASNSNRRQCHKTELKINEILVLDQIVNHSQIFPTDLVPESQIYKDEVSTQSNLNPYLWIVSAQSLYEQLFKKYNLTGSKKSFERKTLLWENVNYKDKFLYAGIFFKEINERMNPRIIQLPIHPTISIVVHQLETGKTTKKMKNHYVEDTIQGLLLDLSWILGVDHLLQFGLYHEVQGRYFYYDKSQRIEDIIEENPKQKNPSLKKNITRSFSFAQDIHVTQQFTLKRKFIFPLEAERELLDASKSADKKIKLFMGEMIQELKSQRIRLNEDELVTYLAIIYSFLSVKQANEYSTAYKKYLPAYVCLNNELIEEITREAKKIQKESRFDRYFEFLEIFMRKDQWITRYFNCKIWVCTKTINISSNPTKFYSAFEFDLGVNYQMLVFRYRKPGPLDLYKKHQLGDNPEYQYIPQELFHSDYILNIVGEVVNLKIKNQEGGNQEVYLVSQNSLQIWRLITVYKVIFGDSH